MSDPLLLLARQKVIAISAELEVELKAIEGSRPTVEILRVLRERAAKSLAQLVECNLFTEQGRAEALTHQNEVKRYDEWFCAIRDLLIAGRQYDDEMNEEDRNELLGYLGQRPDGEDVMISLGIKDPPID